MKVRIQLQKGYFAIVGVILIVVMGLLGLVVVNIFYNRAQLSVTQQKGLSAFYIAESGLEVAARLLTTPNLSGTPSRIACSALTGNGLVTNASLAGGTFTVTAPNAAATYATNALAVAMTTSSTTAVLTSASGFAASGLVIIDGEAISYGGISGNTLLGLTRAISGTLSSHAIGARVGQYLCLVDSKAGIPTVTSPQFQRQLRRRVQLDDAWAVGNSIGGAWNTNRWNYPTELQWSLRATGIASARNLVSVDMLSNGDVWAVGTNAAALRFNGTTWTLSNTGITSNDDLTDVSAVSSQEVWACTEQDRVYRFNGSTWSLSITIPSNPILTGISMVDTNGDGVADTGFVVGNKSTAYRYNSGSWISTTVSVNLNAVSTISANEAWAVANSGAVLRWNGAAWTNTTVGGANFFDIAMMNYNGTTIGWAVGASSNAYYYNGTSWVSRNTGLPGALTITRVNIANPNLAWLVASNGTIYQWNGTTWSLVFTAGAGLAGIAVSHVNFPISGWQQIYA